jgi:hypothetical protein
MQRRKFIARLGVAAAWPIVAKAQERERIRRASVLMNRVATDTEPQSWLAAFIQEMRQLGWTEGQNLRFDFACLCGLHAHRDEIVGAPVRCAMP